MSTGGRSGPQGGGATATGGAVSSGGSVGVEPCPEGEADGDTDPKGVRCEPWSDCKPGEFVAVSPSSTADRVCHACPPGSFSTEDNQQKCQEWRSCSWGDTAVEGTSTSDVECRPPDTFAAVEFDYELQAAGMTATTAGVYLGLNLFGQRVPVILAVSLAGTEAIHFYVPSEEGGFITDLTSLGRDIYAAALTGTDNGLENRTARIVQFDESGHELAVLDLGNQPDEWLLNVLVTSDGADVIVARQVLPMDCGSGKDCAPGVESHLMLSRFDQHLTLIAETRHVGYFNFASISDLKVAGGRIFLSGQLTGNSGIHVFDADGSVLKKYDDFEVGGSVGYIIAPNNAGSAYCIMSEAGPNSSNLAVVDGFTAQTWGPLPHTDTDSMLDMIAQEQGVFLLAHERNREEAVFVELNHQGQLVDRRVEAHDFTYLSEMAQGPEGELFVGGVGDDGDRHGAVIRPWQR